MNELKGMLSISCTRRGARTRPMAASRFRAAAAASAIDIRHVRKPCHVFAPAGASSDPCCASVRPIDRSLVLSFLNHPRRWARAFEAACVDASFWGARSCPHHGIVERTPSSTLEATHGAERIYAARSESPPEKARVRIMLPLIS